jgi:hypothetical protein
VCLLDTNPEEEDGDRETDEDGRDSIEELTEPPVIKGFGNIFRRDIGRVSASSIFDS